MSDTRDLKEGSRHIHALRLRAAITSALVIAAFKSVLPPEKSRSLKAIDYVNGIHLTSSSRYSLVKRIQ